MDLRFAQREEENMFKRSLRKELIQSTFVLSMVALLAFGVMCRPLIWEISRPDDKFAFSVDDPRTLRFGGFFLSAVVFPLSFITSAVLNIRYQSFEWVNWEALSVFIPTFINITLCFCNQDTSTRIFGLETEDVYSRYTDYKPLFTYLYIDAVITAVCLFIPIRMCLKWIPIVLGIVCLVTTSAFFPSEYTLVEMLYPLCLLGFLSGMSLCGAWRNERAARQNFVAQRKVQRKSREQKILHSGTSHLLDRLCDAFVELGPDLCICKPSPRLAALLLRSDSTSIENISFCDFIASDLDRERLITALHPDKFCEAAEVGNFGGMVQLSMRDTHGRRFAVYVYHARVFDDDGACGHMLAVVEAQEREPLTPAAVLSHMAPLEVQKKKRECGESERSEGCSSGTVLEAVVPLVDGSPDEIAAWLDMASSDISITRYSVGFTTFGPITAGSSLANMIVDSSDDFRKWFQKAANLKINGCDASTLPSFTLRLRPKPDSMVEFVTSCNAKLGSMDSDDSNDDDSSLCIVFSDVVCRRRRRSRTQQKQVVRNYDAAIRSPLRL